MKSEFIYREALDYLARNKREKGEKLLIKAANKGYVEAILLLARKYADGIDFGHDHERALVWLKRLLKQETVPQRIGVLSSIRITASIGMKELQKWDIWAA